MNKTFFSAAFISTAIAFVACNNKNENHTESLEDKAISFANFDTTVSPQDDFYQYVNGNWIKSNPIPASESRWNSFNELNDKTLTKLKQILEDAANDTKAEQGSNEQKIGDLYYTGMDSAKLEQEGVSPLEEEFKQIAALKTTADLPKEIAHLHSIGVSPLFNFFIAQDDKNSASMISKLNQGGLGLPDRDYYIKTDKASEDLRNEYLMHVQKMMELLGDKMEVATKEAKIIMDIETKLANASMTRVELRDAEAQYHKMPLQDVNKITPAFNWNAYLEANAVSGVNELIVSQPLFFKEVNHLLETVSMDDWKTYLRWNLINTSANQLSDAFVNQDFHFYGTILSGAKELKPRWKRCLEITDRFLGEALGQLYVKKYFSAESKQRVNEMVDNLTAAYKERINSREWMSEATKKQALAKLGTIMRKLAYPDKWKDYSSLEIKRDSYVSNFFRANTFEFKRMVDKLGKPVDRTEWGMSPPTINAYYNPSLNEIVFPAGIMQPPFFNPEADDAVNYGSIGAVIGHELTHGFDDEGGRFDAEGNLKDWWTPEDKSKFKAKTAILVRQFNSYSPVDTFHVNGELTLGENIADLGGLTIAFEAYKKSLEGKPAPEKINGFTGEQRFFISWAQGWRGNTRPEAEKQMLVTNPHSPGKFRVNGPLSNMPEFYKAFNVKEGNALYRTDSERAEIW